ncbi:hypothetical protein ABT404_46340 [Streptomyces hyaluromycini]|uniref:Transposase n=1 Tax=Streptomyces hyaluromycini TaxID=1377993 RepID=A0ABV1XCZ6_9ACTN
MAHSLSREARHVRPRAACQAESPPATAAAPWQKDLLLQVSRTLELALPWNGRRPPVG